MYEISSKLTIKAPEQYHWCHFGVYVVNLEFGVNNIDTGTSILFACIQSPNIPVVGKYDYFFVFNHITDFSDDNIKTNDANYGVSSNSTNPNVNIVNIKTDHEEEDGGTLPVQF